MRFFVLTVSDRCARGEQVDTAGPAVVELLRARWPAAEIAAGLVADEGEEISALLKRTAEEGVALALTVGGTGMGPRDVTPEATRAVLDREAPGLAEAMRARGAEKNRFAWLSRGVAGLRGRTLIVNLPGSLRGAVESLEAIANLLEHALAVADGGETHPVGEPGRRGAGD